MNKPMSKKMQKDLLEMQQIIAARLPDFDELTAELGRRKLSEFVKWSWPNIEPGRKYVSGWHIDAVCDHLQAVVDGGVRRLIINMPPRHMKSLNCAVAFPAWAWLHRPGLQFMFASYAQSLSTRDSAKCRRLIQSPWYQKHYGDIFQITPDQNQKQRFDNDKSGYRLSTSVGGALTGEGGDIICLTSDQLVRTIEGDLPIGSIVDRKVDVKILSFNHQTEELEWQNIESWQVNPVRPLVEIEFEDGRTITCTEDHTVFVIGKGYVPAQELQDGDEVIAEDEIGVCLSDNGA